MILLLSFHYYAYNFFFVNKLFFTGGAVAIDCVSRAEISSRVAGVVVENTFTSIPDMAKVLFSNVRLLSKLPVWCHKNKVSYVFIK